MKLQKKLMFSEENMAFIQIFSLNKSEDTNLTLLPSLPSFLQICYLNWSNNYLVYKFAYVNLL